MAGVSAGNVNLQRDGVTVNEVRYLNGMNSALRLNNEMIGEFKVLLSPVDAEVGRGNGQVQLFTKSGTNEYHGSVVWSAQNTALDSNQFDFNRKACSPRISFWLIRSSAVRIFKGTIITATIIRCRRR
jgi:hypothetical protein